MAAAPGNSYASYGRKWRGAIERALAKRSRTDQLEALDDLAEKLLELCEQGDLAAIKELGDRIDGRSTQQIVGAGESGEHVVAILRWSNEK